MPPTKVLSQQAEDAVRLIRRQQAVLQRRLLDRAIGAPIVGRLKGWSVGELAEVGSRASIPLHVAVAEEFQRRLLLTYSTAQVPLTSRLLASLWKKAEKDYELSWDRQIDAWKDWHNVRFKEQGWWEEFNGFIEARNALVHGLGVLTSRQVRTRQATVNSLLAAGIAVGADNSLTINQVHIQACADRACDLISWLDSEVA